MRKVQDYLNKKFNYGGILTRRIDIIKDLIKCGGTPQQIDYYMFGLEKSKTLVSTREEAENPKI